MHILFYPIEPIVNFSIENTFSDEEVFYTFLDKFPNRKDELIRFAIDRGDIFLRPPKANPQLPERYKENGWTIHNCSRRKDGMFFKGGAAQFGGPRPTQSTGR